MTWTGMAAEELERELGIDGDDRCSGTFELTRRIVREPAPEEPSMDRPPTWCPALAFGAWPPINGPDGWTLRSVTETSEDVVIAVTSAGWAAAARAETTHGRCRWYRWVIFQPQTLGRRSQAEGGYHPSIYGRHAKP